MTDHTHGAERSEMPAKFLSLLDKVERCIDFESKEAPKWVQVYGRNNTMAAVPVDDWIQASPKSKPNEQLQTLSAVLAMLTCNRNIVAVGYVFPAVRLDIPLGEDDEQIQYDEERLQQLAKEHSSEAGPALYAGFETRSMFYQATANCFVPDRESWSQAELEDWTFLKSTQDELAKEYKNSHPLAGLFLRSKKVLEMLDESTGGDS